MYYLLILVVGIERLIELFVAKRNARWAFSQGGKEFGHDHYPVMVTLHTALLLGCVIEVWGLHRPFIGWLGWPMLAVVAASQVLRWWCVATLGRRWNTLVIVMPDAPLVRRGPYRFLHHPNYVAVGGEGIALPPIPTAGVTALCFPGPDALLLPLRTQVGHQALGYAGPISTATGQWSEA